jgi:hypothetical protein
MSSICDFDQSFQIINIFYSIVVDKYREMTDILVRHFSATLYIYICHA